MSSKALIGSLSLIAALATGGTARADTIYASGTLCQPYNAGELEDIDYVGSGIRNLSDFPRQVICNVPRSTIGSGLLGVFTFTGVSTVGTTSCTLTVYNGTGGVEATQSFVGPTGTWTKSVVLPAADLPNGSAVNLLCTLPASYNTVLRGITSSL